MEATQLAASLEAESEFDDLMVQEIVILFQPVTSLPVNDEVMREVFCGRTGFV